MRKRGANIAGKRLKFKDGMQRKFIREAKNGSGLGWNALAEAAGAHPHTLRIDWGEEKSTIPYTIAKKLAKYHPGEFDEIKSNWVEKILQEHWGQKVGGKKAGGNKKTKKITVPAKSEALAELFGVILGDGYVGKNELTITCAVHEKKYLEHIRDEIRELFGIDSKIFAGYSNKNAIILDCYSCELVKFLTGEGLTSGNKKRNRASIPSWISENTGYSLAALRGLADTDGGIYSKQKGYSRAFIEFQAKIPGIRKGILSMLKKTGFTPSKSVTAGGYSKPGWNIRIQNQDEVRKFFRLVGSSNPKNIVKFKFFLKNASVPANKEVYGEIVNYADEIPYKA